MFTMTENVAPQYTSPTKWERSARSAGRGCLTVEYGRINPLPHRCRDATSPTRGRGVRFPVSQKMLWPDDSPAANGGTGR
jgi:hypothetical protein